MESRTYKAKRKNWRELPKEKWWIEGAIFEGKENSYIITNVKVTDEWEDSEIGADVIGYLVAPETICQDTGLTDKNGRKIFEGDIVRDIFNASVVGIVRYGEYRNTFNDDEYGGHAGFYIEWKEKQDLLRKDLVYWVKNSEFIGNIFDNPELIGEQP